MIKLIYGPMRSGKSARLIEEIEDAKSKKLKIRCYKPEIDTRSKYIKSRNGKCIECITKKSFLSMYTDMLMLNEDIDIIFIDEVQFFDLSGIRIFINFALEKNIKVVASGLNLTSEFEPFDTTARYSMYCDEVEVIKGTCEICNTEESMFSKCNGEKNGKILIGDEIYSQTCFKCYHK